MPENQCRERVISPKRVIVNDYAGHAFTVDLAIEFAKLGIDAEYCYCSTNIAPHGNFSRAEDEGVRVWPIEAAGTFRKYNVVQRSFQELVYGYRSIQILRRSKSEAVLTPNMPILALMVITIYARLARIRVVAWVQDLQSGLAASVLSGRRSWLVKILRGLEGAALSLADKRVVISDSFSLAMAGMPLSPRADRVQPNWAPIEQLSGGDPIQWGESEKLPITTRFLYSGTLGIKHRPDDLATLARHLEARGAHLVVIAEGIGADKLRHLDIPGLYVLPLQPYEMLKHALRSADVLVAVLERDAGPFSVPSKILSYLCVGRPILASIPAGNDASRLVSSGASAGLVDDCSVDVMLEHATILLQDPELRQELGRNGLQYARKHFVPEHIARSFMIDLLSHDLG